MQNLTNVCKNYKSLIKCIFFFKDFYQTSTVLSQMYKIRNAYCVIATVITSTHFNTIQMSCSAIRNERIAREGISKIGSPLRLYFFSARETGFLSLLKLERIPREMRVIPYARSRTKPNEKKVCSSKIRRQSNAGISHPKVSHKSFKRLTVPRNIAEGGPLERS